MPEDFGKFAEKIGVYVAPGGQASIGTQIINGQKQLTPTKFIPRGSIHFVGREIELTMLHEDLQRRDYVAIAGMGGVGKTELATQYARRYQEDYGGIVWFNDRETNLAAEVLEFFRLQFGFEIPQELGGRLLSLKEQVAWCWSKYPNSALPILIVLDDVTDLANLREVVPDVHRFRVLVTTRLRHLDPNFIQEIPLDVLSPQKEPGKALELLKGLLGEKDKRVDNKPQAATEICECLEYLPLGIELVGGYLVRDPEMSLDKMFEQLQERKLEESALQHRETLNSTQLGVKAAFALTWKELDPLAQQLGRFLSLFSPALILWDLVIWVAIGGEEAENQEERQLTWSENELNEAKMQLYGRNLLQQVEQREGCYKIHALVRWFLQEQLRVLHQNKIPPLQFLLLGFKWVIGTIFKRNFITAFSGTKSVLEIKFATAMIALAQNISDSPTFEDIEFFKDVVPHLEDLGKRIIAEIKEAREAHIISLASVPNDQVILVFMGIGKFYKGQGLYKLAEPWCEQCVNVVCQALFAGDHPDVATSLNNLAL
ncbi:NB-ARC domain-containing protein, partial [uncultured Nostoc sp.]|uniref:tetratricopeptide repeat protein n=1 Tax=uncultured Nostoc sp. TaxID=340711 RepID=UPI0035CAB8CD